MMRALSIALVLLVAAAPVGAVTMKGVSSSFVVSNHTPAIAATAGSKTNIIARWDAEDDGTQVADSASSCGSAGSDCDLTKTGTVLRKALGDVAGSTIYVKDLPSGTYVQYNAGFLTTQHHSCANATCDELDLADADGDLMWGGWFGIGSLVGFITAPVHVFGFNEAAGYSIEITSDGTTTHEGRMVATFHCEANDVEKTADVEMDAANGVSWWHVVCGYDATNDELSIFIGGDDKGTPASVTMTSPTGDFYIGFDGAVGFLAFTWDDVWVYDGTLTEAQIAKIGRCGWGAENCTCDAGTPANYVGHGNLALMDNAVTATACNVAAP